ncbi:MAG: hypothetical protein DWB42_13320 [Chloroflexi bacterium]|nr:hypothetical protein [Chloroflexota bacterium]
MRIGGDFSADFHLWSDTFAAVHTAYLVGQILEIGEWSPQLQLYNSLSIHDNSFNDLTQQFFLVTAFQAIIQHSDFCDNSKGCIQIADVKFLFLLDCLETLAQFAASILPLCPQIIPDSLRDFPRSK